MSVLIGPARPEMVAWVHSNLSIQGATVISFNSNDIVILATLCVVNLSCAGIVRHVVLFNSGFVQRRNFFEVLSLSGILTAMVLSLFSILVWVNNPSFVIACTLLWVSLCLFAVVRVWRANRRRSSRDALEFPEFWTEDSVSDEPLPIMTDNNSDDSTVAVSSPPELSINASTPLWSQPAIVKENAIAASPSHAELSRNVVRGKLDRYHDKRVYKSAVISNLSAYRQESTTIATESPVTRTACR